jgi:hypothetical protein
MRLHLPIQNESSFAQREFEGVSIISSTITHELSVRMMRITVVKVVLADNRCSLGIYSHSLLPHIYLAHSIS